MSTSTRQRLNLTAPTGEVMSLTQNVGSSDLVSETKMVITTPAMKVVSGASVVENVAETLLATASAISTETAEREAAYNTIVSGMAQEISDREAAISAEASARQSADNALQASITSEYNARVEADNVLDSAISTEIAARETADTDLAAAIAAEAGLREAADNTEAAAREAADNAIQAAIDAEVTARTDADSALQQQIDTEKGRIDSVLHLSLAELDSFKEISDAFQAADSNLTNLVVNLRTEFNALKAVVDTVLTNEVAVLPTLITQVMADDLTYTVELQMYTAGEQELSLVGNAENKPLFVNLGTFDPADAENPYDGTLASRQFSVSFQGFDDGGGRVYNIVSAGNDFGSLWYSSPGDGNIFDLSSLSNNPLDAVFTNITAANSSFQLSNIVFLSYKNFKAKVRLAGFSNGGNNYLGFAENETDLADHSLAYCSLVSQADAIELYFRID